MERVRKRILSATLVLAIVTLCFLQGQGTTYATQETDYRSYYKVLPEDAEWAEMKSYPQVIEACMLGEEVINSLSTADLLEVVLEYPLFFDIYIWNNWENSAEGMRRRLDGFVALVEREDVVECLIQKYIAMGNPNEGLSIPYFNKIAYLECILSDKAVLEKMTDEQRERLLDANERVNELRKAHSELVLNIDYGTEAMAETTSYVYTPKGSKVTCITGKEDYKTEEARQFADEITLANNRTVTMLRSSCKCYNCFSYAFYSRSANNKIWINAPHPKLYIEDGSYVEVTSLTDIRTGDIIVYYNDYDALIHAGVVNVVTTMNIGMPLWDVISKWGEYGLYEHKYNYSSYEGQYTHLKIYRRAE